MFPLETTPRSVSSVYGKRMWFFLFANSSADLYSEASGYLQGCESLIFKTHTPEKCRKSCY